MATRNGKRVVLIIGTFALIVIIVAVFVGWSHLFFWYRYKSIGKNAQGYPEYRHRQTGIVLVLLPGGKFLMGAQNTDPNGPNYDPDAKDDEGPVHEVTMSPFLIGKFEVTQGQWKSVMGSNPAKKFNDDANLPVEYVSWNDIQQFETKTGLTLPTEAQWEYACRAGTNSPYAGIGNLDEMGWYSKNSGTRLHPIGKKAPNAFGLYDTHGNVEELCEDVYDRNEGYRAARGGSWRYKAGGCRSSYRGSLDQNFRDLNIGFRACAAVP